MCIRDRYYDPREYYEDTEYIMVFKFENDEWDNPEQYLNHMNELEEEIRIYNGLFPKSLRRNYRSKH